MVVYETLSELQEEFIAGEFEYLELIQVENVTYSTPIHRSVPIAETDTGSHIMSVYRAREGDGYLGFVWNVAPNKAVYPQDVVQESEIITISESALGYEEQVILYGLDSEKAYPCKIDTGADFCSLHADDISVTGSQVVFVYDGKRYRMNLADTHNIQQADSDAEARPVISLSVKLGGQVCKDVLFNLNDRSQMDSQILIGRNLLDKHDFTIHTNDVTAEQWSQFDDALQGKQLNEASTTITVEQLAKMVLETDLTFKQLGQIINREAINTVSSIEY